MNPIFAQITKVDEERREVTGRAAQEIVDRDNEILDYNSSKPEFMKWSAEVSADTEGKSLGNVRSMHGNVAAGKLTNIDFNDAERAIDITAKIVDDNEWKKCLEGVMTGFSIGGAYKRKWADIQNGKMVQRYTAIPHEVSIVDRPCIPTAKFYSIHKRDGSVVRKVFLNGNDGKMNPELSRFIANFGPAFLAMKKANAYRPKPLEKLFADSRPAPTPLRDRTALEIKKAHRAAGSVEVDVVAVKKMIRRNRLRKVVLPPQSRNGQNDNITAYTGATNNWRDQIATTPAPTLAMCGPGVVSDMRANAAAAIREILSRPPQRMGC